MTRNREYQINCIVFKKQNKDIKFLLLKRIAERGGFWQSITGGVGVGEDRIKAIRRELKEETGITKFKKVIDTKFSYSFVNREGRKLEEHVYGIEINPNQKITLSWEHTERKWVDLKEALKLLKYKNNKKAFKILYQRITS